MSLKLRILLILESLLLTLTFTFKSTLKTKLYDKRDDFTLPIVNFPFINSNIPASPAYGVYISLLIRYSRVCAHYSDFLDIPQLLTQNVLKQGYADARLKSSQYG